MIILGIETTCDETGAGIVEDGKIVLSNVVSSSAALQKKYSGVVPEVAAREQVKVIIPVLEEALNNAGLRTGSGLRFIDAIAVASGPGLLGSLLIGVETAKALAVVWKKPLIPVNHLIGHVYANWINGEGDSGNKGYGRIPKFPLVALIVSGGHTDLILMTDHQKFRWLGGTRDDAAGEVFDKVARTLGLEYPGGPEIEKVASPLQRRVRLWRKSPAAASSLAGRQSGKSKVKFPRPMINDDNFDFSFSGLKTSVVNLVDKHLQSEGSSHLGGGDISAIAYEFQNAIIEVLVAKTTKAAKKNSAKSIVVGGGVAANENLREQFTASARGEARQGRHFSDLNIPVYFPSKILSVDNGTMIAAAAFYQRKYVDPLKLQADPSLHLGI